MTAITGGEVREWTCKNSLLVGRKAKATHLSHCEQIVRQKHVERAQQRHEQRQVCQCVALGQAGEGCQLPLCVLAGPRDLPSQIG